MDNVAHGNCVKTVDILDLKSRLSEYVRQIRGGETILPTDRGEVVVELRPPKQGSIDRWLPPQV